MELLSVTNVKKIYNTRLGAGQVEALTGVSFSVEQGEFVAIMGASGSGKTTLLNILASLDRPTAGEVQLEGTPMSTIKDKSLSSFRRNNLGFVFQDFNLLDNFNVRDNILLPLVLSNTSYPEMDSRLQSVIKQLSISELLNKYPYEISGGQKQRVAVARAIITNPKLLLADEPTGALDSKASQNLLHIISSLNEQGQTILMVTHSSQAASYASRVIFIKDGTLFTQLYRGDENRQEFFNHIVSTLTVLSDGGVDVG